MLVTLNFTSQKLAHAIDRFFSSVKIENLNFKFHWKKFDIFHMFAQNIDSWFQLVSTIHVLDQK